MIEISKVDYLLEEHLDILNEEQIAFLIENRLDFVKKTFKDKIGTSHDMESSKYSSDQLIDQIASKIDPTVTKSHTQWLTNRYKDGDFKLSDGKSVKKIMTDFENHKRHLEISDLNQYKSVRHIKDALATIATKLKNLKQESKSDVMDMPVVFQEGNNIGYKIPNKKTSIHNYGPNGKMAKTVWCTAANGTANLFNSYTYEGGKYTLHLDNGHVLQINHGSGAMQDVNNVPVDINDDRFKKHSDVISSFVSATSKLEGMDESMLTRRYVPFDDAGIMKLHDEHIKSGMRLAHKVSAAVSNSRISDGVYQLLKGMKTINANTVGDTFVPANAHYNIVHSKFAKPEHLDDVANDFHQLSSEQATKLIKNANTSAETQSKIIDAVFDPGFKQKSRLHPPGVLAAIASHGHNLTSEIYHRLDPYLSSERFVANYSAKVPEKYFDEVFSKGIDYHVMAGSPSLPHHIAEKIITSPHVNPGTLKMLAQNHNLPPRIIHMAIDHGALDDRSLDIRKVLAHPDFTPDDVSNVVDKVIPKYPVHAAKMYLSNRLGRRDIQTIIKSPLESYGIANHTRIRSDDLIDMIDRMKEHHSDDVISSIMGSHALSSKVVDRLVDKNLISDDMVRSIHEEVPTHIITGKHLHAFLDSDKVHIMNKQRVLMHPSVQLSHFQKVVSDPRYHGAITNSKNAPPSILHRLATSPMDHVRANIANNKNTEKVTHDMLKSDPNPEIASISARKAQ